MIYTLRNKHLEVHIDHPLINYQSSRFDWTGKISEIKYRGLPMTITEKPDGENENVYGKGLYNEFSMDTALGFNEAQVGEWFHKIGVGLLKKDSPDYEFFRDYEIKPAQFDVLVEVDRIKIECLSHHMNGYEYRLLKEVVLEDEKLIINYSLENTGYKIIEVEEYVHNFMAINAERVDSKYQLRFPFHLHSGNASQLVDPDDILDIGKDEIKFKSRTENQFFASYLNGEKRVESGWELIHLDQKVGIRETTSFPTNKVNIWGWKHVISPELFHEFKLIPGDTEDWSRTYQFFQFN